MYHSLVTVLQASSFKSNNCVRVSANLSLHVIVPPVRRRSTDTQVIPLRNPADVFSWHTTMSSITQWLLDPRIHDYLAIVKGARNGFVYGVKVRFPHALIMAILFGRGEYVFLCVWNHLHCWTTVLL